MAELQYKLMTSAVNNFDCGNSAINEYVENSYFATLLQQCYAYEIEYKSLVVGYYMITFRDVAFYDCISEISDYQIDDFGEFLPSLYITAMDWFFTNSFYYPECSTWKSGLVQKNWI